MWYIIEWRWKESMNRKLFYLYHLVVKHDVFSPLTIRRFGKAGKGLLIFKPIQLDRKRSYIHLGNNVVIRKYARINCYPGWNAEKDNEPIITIGDGCIIGQRLSLLAGGKITIGNNVLMASDILVTSENHSIDPEDVKYYKDQPLKCADVEIKEGSWIGEKVCIMPGVTIGKKSIIGAGSIVTKDIPDYSIAVGNPAHVIKKYDFEKHQWVQV